MNAMKKRISVVLVLLVLLAVFPLQSFAAGPIKVDQNAALNISFKDSGKAIPGAQFSIYKVADVDGNTNMTVTSDFEAYKNTVSGLSDLNHLTREQWMTLASSLKGYVLNDNLLPVAGGKTDSSGNLTFSGLTVGLYLVVGSRVSTGGYTYTPTPFMVFLPGVNTVTNDWDYNVTTEPKYTKEKNPPGDKFVTRKVLKIWSDEGHESVRPDKVTVTLLRDGEVYDTQTLSKDTNWRCVWDKLDGGCEWDVIEKAVDDYTAAIEVKGVTFTVTNSYQNPDNPDQPDNPPVDPPDNPDQPDNPTDNPDQPDNPDNPGGKLPQTGMPWWPVPLLLGAGLVFVMIGVIRRRKYN